MSKLHSIRQNRKPEVSSLSLEYQVICTDVNIHMVYIPTYYLLPEVLSSIAHKTSIAPHFASLQDAALLQPMLQFALSCLLQFHTLSKQFGLFHPTMKYKLLIPIHNNIIIIRWYCEQIPFINQ
mgnify:FL=1